MKKRDGKSTYVACSRRTAGETAAAGLRTRYCIPRHVSCPYSDCLVCRYVVGAEAPSSLDVVQGGYSSGRTRGLTARAALRKPKR
jgi:hypothetical protein